MNKYSSREILIFLNRKYHGEWDKIYNAIQNHEEIPDNIEIEQNHKVVTLLDDNYPVALKNCWKPPFCIFFEGSLEILKKDNIMCVAGCGSGDKRTLGLLKDLSNQFVLINGMDSPIEELALTEAMKNKMPIILLLDDSIDNSDLDNPLFLYACENGCVISEIGYQTNDIQKVMLSKTRIIAWLCNKALITSSKKNNTRLCLLIEELLSKGTDLFVLPEKPFENSLNNELIQNGALLVNKRIDIF